MFFFLLIAVSLAWILWVSARPKSGCLSLSDFATLLEQPEVVRGVENTLVKRVFLKGEFRGRKVVALVQTRKFDRYFIVSMETHAPATMEPYAFTGDRFDREGALAVFALEVKHEFKLLHEKGCLKARWAPEKTSLFSLGFPPGFDTPKSQSVLEAMHTLAASIERRAAAAVA